jgi:hypothetical protein
MEIPSSSAQYLQSKLGSLLPQSHSREAHSPPVALESKCVVQASPGPTVDPSPCASQPSYVLKFNMVQHGACNADIAISGTRVEMARRLEEILKTHEAGLFDLVGSVVQEHHHTIDDSTDNSCKINRLYIPDHDSSQIGYPLGVYAGGYRSNDQTFLSRKPRVCFWVLRVAF